MQDTINSQTELLQTLKEIDENNTPFHIEKDSNSISLVTDNFTLEIYNHTRDQYNNYKKTGSLPLENMAFIGYVGFCGSYNGRFFDGGFAQNSENRIYWQECWDNILKQNFSQIDGFGSYFCYDFLDLYANHYEKLLALLGKNEIKNNVFYFDPPYKNTKNYSLSRHFDHDLFWQIVRELSIDNIVFVSEESAPHDFEVVWSKKICRTINALSTIHAQESLFCYTHGKK